MPLPPNVANGDYLKLTAQAYTLNQIAQVSCHFKVSNAIGLSVSVQDIANAWVLVTDGQWPQILAAAARADDARVELLSPATGKVLQSAIGISNQAVGTVPGSQSPTQVSAVVSKETGFAGQANRGRVYFPFVPQGFLTADGEMTVAAQTLYGITFDTFFPSFVYGVGGNTAQLSPVILHTPGTAHPLPLSSLDILSRSSTGRFGTQKRRGDYGKPNRP